MTSLDPSIAAFTAFLDVVKAFRAQDRTSLSQDQLQGEAQKLLDILVGYHLVLTPALLFRLR